MSEEKAPEAAATEAKPSKNIVKSLIITLVVVVVFAVGALLTYKLVLGPMFVKAEEESQPAEEDPNGAIPEGAVPVKFEEASGAALSEDPSVKTSVLTYSICLLCSGEEAKELVEGNKLLFEAKFSELHRNKTRAELNDPQVQKSILKQAREEANSLLRRLQKKPDPEIRIIEVLYLKFAVFDL